MYCLHLWGKYYKLIFFEYLHQNQNKCKMLVILRKK